MTNKVARPMTLETIDPNKMNLACQLTIHYRTRVKGGFVPTAPWRVQRHTKETWWGKSKVTEALENGKTIDLVPCEGWETGGLLLADSLYVVDYCLSRGVSPYTGIHIWYDKGKLQITLHWRILKGWAESVKPFRTYFFELSAEDKVMYNIIPGDVATLAINVLDEDVNQMGTIIASLLTSDNPPSFPLAQRQAAEIFSKGKAAGIVREDELCKAEYKDDKPTGRKIPREENNKWSWADKAQTRALRTSIGRSHGDPTPSQVKNTPSLLGFTIETQDLEALTDSGFPTEAPAEVQGSYLQASQVKTKGDTGTDMLGNQGAVNPTTGQAYTTLERNANLLRGEEDFDPVTGETVGPTYNQMIVAPPSPQDSTPAGFTPIPGIKYPTRPHDLMTQVNQQTGVIAIRDLVELRKTLGKLEITVWPVDLTGWAWAYSKLMDYAAELVTG